MSNNTVGVLTIGQSPRTDVTPSLERIFGSSIRMKEAGALDSLSACELLSVQPSKDTETTYVSRLRNGNSMKMDKEKLLPLLQKELTELEKEADVIIILCTGNFPTLQTVKPIFYPDKVLSSTVQAIMGSGKLGVIIPLEEQKKAQMKKWKQHNVQLRMAAASPYEKSDIFGAAKKLEQEGVEAIVLDCIGYNELHKAEAIKGSQLPVILPRTLLASIVKEYIPGGSHL